MSKEEKENRHHKHHHKHEHDHTYDHYIHDFIDRYFHFLEMPDFVPYEYIERFGEMIKRYIESRAGLAEHIKQKEEAWDSLTIDPILKEINGMSDDYAERYGELANWLTNYDNTIYPAFKEANNELKSVLNGVIEYQNNYKWL